MIETKHLWENNPVLDPRLRANDEERRALYPEILHLGRSRLHLVKPVNVTVVDFESGDVIQDWRLMDMPENYYDYIIADGSFNCLPVEDYPTVLERCHKALSKDGQFRVRLYTDKCTIETPRLLSKLSPHDFCLLAFENGFSYAKLAIEAPSDEPGLAPIVVLIFTK